MQRLIAVNPVDSTGKTKQLLDGVQAKLGMTPNMMRTMANAPAALQAYLNFGSALATGTLDAQFREELALTIAQANSCEYCLAAHTAIGGMVGLNSDQILASREAKDADSKRTAGLRFAQTLVIERGQVSDATLAQVKTVGYNDGEIAEIIANVAINLFTNYFNHVARTEVDFPAVPLTLAAHS